MGHLLVVMFFFSPSSNADFPVIHWRNRCERLAQKANERSTFADVVKSGIDLGVKIGCALKRGRAALRELRLFFDNLGCDQQHQLGSVATFQGCSEESTKHRHFCQVRDFR